MLQSPLWLAFLLLPTAGAISTWLKPHYSDNLKTTCDSLLYRSVYHQTHTEASCYFVIDAYLDSIQTSELCSRVIDGAKLAVNVSHAVYRKVWMDKNEFIADGESTGKAMKAMCVYESRFPCLKGSYDSSDTCVRSKRQNIEYRLHGSMIMNFKEKLQPGQFIEVKGVAFADFTINLKKDEANWPLRISIYFSDGKIGFHTCVNGVWLNGKATQMHPSVIQKGVPYEIQIEMRDNHFVISINRLYGYQFDYNVPLSTATQLLAGAKNDTTYYTHVHLGKNYEPFPSVQAKTYDFPLCREAKCSRTVCKSMVVSGLVRDKPPSFLIQLFRANGDVAFSFKPSGNQVAMGNKRSGKWENEVKEQRAIPYKKNSRFEVAITSDARAYQIAVAGDHFTSFTHRAPLNDIVRVAIFNTEDVDVQIK